ncbi:unnamed protein product [Albugo candida]|uniref:GAF domain-containing protein n=1 Tax=Albugo candida TaxID=65357 RepID=A0A024G855_9STRA|nr:unnamed protein product [Albugo candida]|eukprot:CCI43056.1 unnamed protein product [Albugo candida]
MATGGPEHSIYNRLNRQQLAVRRRHIGHQCLIFEYNGSQNSECIHCGRNFNDCWKALLCHICGYVVCVHCSHVYEREREPKVIRFIRGCMRCSQLLNKWTDSELLLDPTTSAALVTQSSKFQLDIHLAHAIRTHSNLRNVIMQLLQHFGIEVDPHFYHMVESIPEEEWAIVGTGRDYSSHFHEKMSGLEIAQHLVQQCFEIDLEELPIEECVFAEQDGTRCYRLKYDVKAEIPDSPFLHDEPERMIAINSLDLSTQSLCDLKFICELVSSELDAAAAFVSVIQNDTLRVMVAHGIESGTTVPRGESFCAYALTSFRPFLIKDALLDIRFRNFKIVRQHSVRCYLSFPILSKSDRIIASFCIIDTRPRKSITTMQYSVLKALAKFIGHRLTSLNNQ